MPIEDIHMMADEVAELMASRFGGARRGQRVELQAMLRRRGAALPRKLRREAMLLAEADLRIRSPKLAKQVDQARLVRAHKALVGHLKPLGMASRWQGNATAIAASVALALLLAGAVAIWIMIRRGLI